jgi:hypothetical protein
MEGRHGERWIGEGEGKKVDLVDKFASNDTSLAFSFSK